jgi:hypothetical protein
LGRHEKSTARGRNDLGQESKIAKNTRRDFIKQSALGTAAMLVYPHASVLGANDRVRVAMIGVGGRGEELLKQVLRVPNAQLVANRRCV